MTGVIGVIIGSSAYHDLYIYTYLKKKTNFVLQKTCLSSIHKHIFDAGKLANGVNITMSSNLELSPNDEHTFTYGTISCGADTYSGTWSKGKQIFSCNNRLRSKCESHCTNFFPHLMGKV